MKAEEWTKACEAAAKAVELEPLSTSSLIRLSTCHEEQRNYVSAFTYFSRAIAILPSYEQPLHRAKIARLAEQLADAKAKVFRGDPFDILPLEVIIEAMRIGLESDKNFVLKNSWTNRRWRSTLNTRCPALELPFVPSMPHQRREDGREARNLDATLRKSSHRTQHS